MDEVAKNWCPRSEIVVHGVTLHEERTEEIVNWSFNKNVHSFSLGSMHVFRNIAPFFPPKSLYFHDVPGPGPVQGAGGSLTIKASVVVHEPHGRGAPGGTCPALAVNAR